MFKAEKKNITKTHSIKTTNERHKNNQSFWHYTLYLFAKKFENQKETKKKRDHDIERLWLINIVISEYMNIQINNTVMFICFTQCYCIR